MPCKQVKKLATVLTSTESTRRYKGTLVLAEARLKTPRSLPQRYCLHRSLRSLPGMPLLKRALLYGSCNSPAISSMRKIVLSQGEKYSGLD